MMEREMFYNEAKQFAEKYLELLRPGCKRIEIVGSVKRGDKSEVHDIEYLCIADERRERPEFIAKKIPPIRFHQVLDELCERGLLRFVLGGERQRKYVLREARTLNPFHIEVYIVKPETWGIQNVIRTGPSDFSHKFVTNRKYGGLLPDDLVYVRGETKILRGGMALNLPEEADALALIGKGWIEPRDRQRFVYAPREAAKA